MVIPNPGHTEDMERYRLQNTVVGGGAKQYLYMTISSTFQLSFSTLSQKDTQIAIKTHYKLLCLLLHAPYMNTYD